MRIHLIKKRSIDLFIENHAQSKNAFKSWLAIINSADWSNKNDILKTMNTADFISEDRVIFNIGGNNYRIICKIVFGHKKVHLFIKWIGSHEEYSIDNYR